MRKKLTFLTLCVAMMPTGCSNELTEKPPVEPYSISSVSHSRQVLFRFPAEPFITKESDKTYFGRVNSIIHSMKKDHIEYEIRELYYSGFYGSDDRLLEYDSTLAIKNAHLKITSDLAFESSGYNVREVRGQINQDPKTLMWISWAVKGDAVYRLTMTADDSKASAKAAKAFFKNNLFWFSKK